MPNYVPQLDNEWRIGQIPDGLVVLNDFVDDSEELDLLACIDWSLDATSSKGSTLKHRLVRHFGYTFCYDTSNVDRNHPLEEKIPEKCNFLISRLKAYSLANMIDSDWQPDQLTVNRYQPGQGIPAHIDTHSAFDDVILSLSLGSDIVMDFKHKDGRHFPVLLKQRSMLIMSGESRYNWSHGITQRKQDVVPSKNGGLSVQQRKERISFTFRRVRNSPCACIYPDCDSKNQFKQFKMSDHTAEKLEALHVHKVYDNIAEHFNETRHKPWPNVVSFINSLQPGSLLVDVGCGNGKYLTINPSVYKIGCDRNATLVSLCAEKGFHVLLCDCLQLPFYSSCADACISIAVIHHLATPERRRTAVQEMVRILKPGGVGLIYVWAKKQKVGSVMSSYMKQDSKNRRGKNIETLNDTYTVNFHNETLDNVEASSDTKVKKIGRSEVINETHLCDDDYHLLTFPVHVNRMEFMYADVLVPWKVKPKMESNVEKCKYLRYYHIFEENELEKVCASLENIKIVKGYYDEGNWCVIFKKI